MIPQCQLTLPLRRLQPQHSNLVRLIGPQQGARLLSSRHTQVVVPAKLFLHPQVSILATRLCQEQVFHYASVLHMVADPDLQDPLVLIR